MNRMFFTDPAIAGVFVLLGLFLVTLWRTFEDLLRSKEGRLTIVRVLLLGGAAFAVRWLLTNHGLLHENRHGFPFDFGADASVFNWAAHDVASSHLSAMALFHQLYSSPHTSIFAFGALMSSLAVVGIESFARQVSGSRLVGWSCAAMLMFQPLAIFLSTSEEFMLSAAGWGLAGMALTVRGYRTDKRWMLAAGLAAMDLAACSREVAVLLFALVPLTLLAAVPQGEKVPWRRIILLSSFALAGLLVQAVNVVEARLKHPAATGLIALPHTPFDEKGLDVMWVGWQAPYIPRWMGALILAGLVGVLLAALLRWASWRVVVGFVLTTLVAWFQGGLVTSGWFPSNLRHQLFALTVAMLPAGWLLGTLLDRVAAFAPDRWIAAPAWLIAPTLGIATLARSPEVVRPELPIVQEYRFLKEAMERLPNRARLYVYKNDSLGFGPHLEGWVRTHRPDLDVRIFNDAVPHELEGGGDGKPAWLLLDRVCFMNLDCIDSQNARRCFDDEVRRAQPHLESPFGRLAPACHALHEALPWRERLTLEVPVRRPEGNVYFDLPSVDDTVRLALLEASGTAP